MGCRTRFLLQYCARVYLDNSCAYYMQIVDWRLKQQFLCLLLPLTDVGRYSDLAQKCLCALKTAVKNCFNAVLNVFIGVYA